MILILLLHRKINHITKKLMNGRIKTNLYLAVWVGVPSLVTLWFGGWIAWLITFTLYFIFLRIITNIQSLKLWSLLMTLGITEEEYVALVASDFYKKNDVKMMKWLYFGGKRPRYKSSGLVQIDHSVSA